MLIVDHDSVFHEKRDRERDGRLCRDNTLMSTLHLVCGMAGSGKTTLSKKLERQYAAMRLSPDEWIETLLKNKTDRSEMDRLRPRVHDLQWDLAMRLLRTGVNVVWEQGFWHAEERLAYLEAAKETGSSVVLHYLDVPIDEIKRRIMVRNENLPGGSFLVDPAEIDLWMTWFQPPDDDELAMYDDHHRYDR